jgi:hypothetical protein
MTGRRHGEGASVHRPGQACPISLRRYVDTVTRRPIALLPVEAVTGFALSPDGKALAAGRSDGEILIYGLEEADASVARP